MRLPLNARRCCQYKLEVPVSIPRGGNSWEIQLMQPCEEESFILIYYQGDKLQLYIIDDIGKQLFHWHNFFHNQ